MIRRKNDIQTIGDPMTGHALRSRILPKPGRIWTVIPLAHNGLQYERLVSRFEKMQLDSFLPDPDLMPQSVSLDASDAE
jgi:hypothetical protein